MATELLFSPESKGHFRKCNGEIKRGYYKNSAMNRKELSSKKWLWEERHEPHSKVKNLNIGSSKGTVSSVQSLSRVRLFATP